LNPADNSLPDLWYDECIIVAFGATSLLAPALRLPDSGAHPAAHSMKCPECGHSASAEDAYCAACGTRLVNLNEHIRELISTQVHSGLDARFRDQKLVELDLTERVLSRLQRQMKLFAFWVGIPLAIIGIGIAIAGLNRYRDFSALMESVEKQIRPKLEQAQQAADTATKTAIDAQSKADAAKKDIEETSAKTRKELSSANTLAAQVRALSSRVTSLEQDTTKEIAGARKRVNEHVGELDKKIETASKEIADQQKKLANTDEIVKALYSKGRTQYVDTKTASQQFVALQKTKRVAVYFLLTDPPIYQTVQLVWHVYTQPKGSYSVVGNVVVFMWGDPLENLKNYPLEISYVPDPTAGALRFSSLALRDGHVYADGNLLPDVE
jgi:hypothetical protein